MVVLDRHELSVEVASGRGDANAQKSLGVQVNNSPTLGANGGTTIGQVIPVANASNSQVFSINRLSSAASTNATSVKGSNGVLVGGSVVNTVASTRYLKFYNKASAPTVGTDTPVLTYAIPGNSIVAVHQLLSTFGHKFSTGIAYAITGAYADADTTAIGAGDIVLNLLYL